MELKKTWNNGGSLTATYEGSGDGTAVFSSDANEGIDRETTVIFSDKEGTVTIEKVVRQEGLRQPYRLKNGGVYRVSSGGRYGVLKFK